MLLLFSFLSSLACDFSSARSHVGMFIKMCDIKMAMGNLLCCYDRDSDSIIGPGTYTTTDKLGQQQSITLQRSDDAYHSHPDREASNTMSASIGTQGYRSRYSRTRA
jgi:hypothetical protein